MGWVKEELPMGKPVVQVFSSLQLWRGLAALLVVLFHTSLIFTLEKYWGADPMKGLFSFGAAGVEMFFVISGFIILHVHWGDIGVPGKLPGFLKKRFVRIICPYLPQRCNY